MYPHAQNFYHLFFADNLIEKPVPVIVNRPGISGDKMI